MSRPEFLERALDYLFPPSCQQCEASTEAGSYLCETCYSQAARIEEPYCKRCGEHYEGEILNPGFLCSNCHNLEFAFDFALSAMLNTQANHQLVVDYKYRKQRYLSRVLARFCAEALTEKSDFSNHPDKVGGRFSQLEDPVLVPVPLHWRKQWQRGFNQAELLAKELSRRSGLPKLNLLKRRHHTGTQTRLRRSQRMENLKNAFVARPLPVDFRSVILIDDVFTTGATSHACAAAVRKASPEVQNIVVLTALRG